MGQIALKDIKNPSHRKLMEHYGKQLSSTPLKTRFHDVPHVETESEALAPELDFSALFSDELAYRLYTKNAISILVYGDRRDYKSTVVLKLWLEWYKIAEESKVFDAPLPDYENIVDNDITLLDRYMKAPAFSAFIKDEFDTNMSGLGNMTTSQTLINVIKRSAYHQKPIFICSPVFKCYPVDYYLQTWEYRRYSTASGRKEVLCIVYDKNAVPKGHAYFAMPTDEEIAAYDRRKQDFMGNMSRMRFTIEEELDEIAEKLITLPPDENGMDADCFDLSKKIDQTGFKSWAFKKYPVLQSKVMQQNIMERVQFMQKHGLKKMC